MRIASDRALIELGGAELAEAELAEAELGEVEWSGTVDVVPVFNDGWVGAEVAESIFWGCELPQAVIAKQMSGMESWRSIVFGLIYIPFSLDLFDDR